MNMAMQSGVQGISFVQMGGNEDLYLISMFFVVQLFCPLQIPFMVTYC